MTPVNTLARRRRIPLGLGTVACLAAGYLHPRWLVLVVAVIGVALVLAGLAGLVLHVNERGKKGVPTRP